jgi:hypothetical protein
MIAKTPSSSHLTSPHRVSVPLSFVGGLSVVAFSDLTPHAARRRVRAAQEPEQVVDISPNLAYAALGESHNGPLFAIGKYSRRGRPCDISKRWL